MERVTRLRIFVASPSDVTEERRALQDLVGRLEYDPGIGDRAALSVVTWDNPGTSTPLLANLDPQGAVIRGLPLPSECDIVVIILWSRFGSALSDHYVKDDGTPYLSGTEWEYLEALRAAETSGRPDILVYRCLRAPSIDPRQPLPILEEAHRQAQMVDAFFQTMRSDLKGPRGYNSYDSVQSFSALLEEHLRLIVTQQLASDAAASRFFKLLTSNEERLPSVTPTDLGDALGIALSPRAAPHIRALSIDAIRESLGALTRALPRLIESATSLGRNREYLVAKAAVRLLGAIARQDPAGSQLLTLVADHPNWEVSREVVRALMVIEDKHFLDVATKLNTPLYHGSFRLIIEYLEQKGASLPAEERHRAASMLQHFAQSSSYAETTMTRLSDTLRALTDQA